MGFLISWLIGTLLHMRKIEDPESGPDSSSLPFEATATTATISDYVHNISPDDTISYPVANKHARKNLKKNKKNTHHKENDILEAHINKIQDTALRESLSFHNKRIAILNSDPASRTFLVWFFISCYFPVITACLGPIANTISIACVVEKWRAIAEVDPTDGNVMGHRLNDRKGIFAVNILSLIFGFISNIILVCHFAKKISYLKAQVLNLIGWTTAGLLLLIDIIICTNIDFQGANKRTIGFWYACFTTGLYLGCTLTLTIHFIGYSLKKYPATFNLLPRERSIMGYTVCLSLWLIWGSGMFSSLLGISYGNALYFCTVSLLTVGFGDILPKSVASKIMILVFSLTGVIILGLIVFMTRSIIQKSAGPIFYFHRIERSRNHIWEKIKSGELKLSNEESFQKMMKIRKISKFKQHFFSLTSTIIIFLFFWLCGAVVFMFAEDWSYFNCMYFCFLCLLTIGYGSDFAPKTPPGRAFFVIWAIGAVPLMTAILSTVGDIVYDLSTTIDSIFAKRFGRGVQYLLLSGKDALGSILMNTGDIVNESDAATDLEENGISNELDQEQNQEVEEGLARVTPDTSTETSLNTISSRSDNGFSDDDDDESIQNYLHPFISLVSDTSTVSQRAHPQYHKLKKLESLLRAVDRLHKMAVSDEKHFFTYEEWTQLRALNNPPGSIEDINYWLSSDTPLKYPINQPHFAFVSLFKKIEYVLQELIEEETLYKPLSKLERPKSRSQSSIPTLPYRSRRSTIG
ncbi:Tok1p NDAI_0G05490 [Naumovozyma dairenensis CBS 421]|uniref:Potassium channel domain-containing protein n=1 Tax=Naumovozyma dairenensis (strain ATCC 10597 / BCRC 20456 / CBS 421 / NBRC 0211 / NRRL Y-12639) TaxID=1071378 RepID=J7RTH0_NAUDC|nr:hypothetical protein NDAI_0G05490 [Naumovozyma dairenensis CBS 421]CCK73532.1 hypothetical protein NDAI_0G05490 [Naumovozyma dairenensis CBS 421]